MNEMIKLYDLFGTEIRSRSNADVLREKILDCNISIIDLSQITFISRSLRMSFAICLKATISKFITQKAL